MNLDFIDWFIFFLILILTFLFIYYGNSLKDKSKGDDSILEHLLMGRRLTLPMFVATLVATWYGGIFGVTQITFEKGIYNFLIQGVFWYLTYLIFAFWLVKRVYPFKAMTLPDLFSKMFGTRAYKISAIFNFFNVVPIVYTISLGLFLHAMFGGNILFLTFVGVILVVIYSMFGGFRAIVFSDILQFGVMIVSVSLVLFFSIQTYGGLEFLQARLPSNHLKLDGGQSIGLTIAWGLIALSTLVDPNFYQRCFSAKSEKVAKNGIIISTIVWVLFDICTTVGALYARAVMPQAESNKAYLLYALELLPGGFKGLFLAGIFATILSTIDSYLFIAGTTLTYDLFPTKYRQKLWIHRLGILFVGLLAILLSYFFEGNIRNVWKTLGSYSAACLLIPALYGHIFKFKTPNNGRDKQFVLGVIMGVVATTVWRNVSITFSFGTIDELYVGSFATLFGLILGKLLYRKEFKNNCVRM